jgi:hypothetical protein
METEQDPLKTWVERVAGGDASLRMVLDTGVQELLKRTQVEFSGKTDGESSAQMLGVVQSILKIYGKAEESADLDTALAEIMQREFPNGPNGKRPSRGWVGL